VNDVPIRDLLVPAVTLGSPVVWAEVFARCDDPPTEARWSDLSVSGADRTEHRVAAVNVTYQDTAAGGCSNTEATVDGGHFVQRTGSAQPRPLRAPRTLTLPGGRPGDDWRR
jgi:hypothetical protein